MIVRNIFRYLLFLLFLLPVDHSYAQAGRVLIEVGDLRYEFGDYEGAADAYTLAMEYHPASPQLYNKRGLSKSASGNDEGAIEDFNHAIEINDSYIPAYLNRAASKYNKEDYYGAIEDYGLVIEQDQENAIAWYGRGISQLQIKYYVGACDDLKQALDLGVEYARDLIRENCR